MTTYPTLLVHVVIERSLGLWQRYIRTRQAEVLITYFHKQNFSWWCIKIMAIRVVELPVTIEYEIITQTCELGVSKNLKKIVNVGFKLSLWWNLIVVNSNKCHVKPGYRFRNHLSNLMKGKAFSIYGLSFSELRLSPPLSGMPISMICARDLSKAQS